MSEIMDTIGPALVARQPNHTPVAVTIQAAATASVSYPVLGLQNAQLLPNDEITVDPDDPDTYLHYRPLAGDIIQSVAIYLIPDLLLDEAELQDWADRVRTDPLHRPYFKGVTLEVYKKANKADPTKDRSAWLAAEQQRWAPLAQKFSDQFGDEVQLISVVATSPQLTEADYPYLLLQDAFPVPLGRATPAEALGDYVLQSPQGGGDFYTQALYAIEGSKFRRSQIETWGRKTFKDLRAKGWKAFEVTFIPRTPAQPKPAAAVISLKKPPAD